MDKSNILRIIFGLFYLAAAVFNFTYTLRHPQQLRLFYDSFAENALIPFYKDFILSVVVPNSDLIILMVVVFEIVVGILILSKRIFVKVGLSLGILWTLFFVPILAVGPPMLTNLILASLQVFLLKKEYDKSFLEILRSKFHSK